MKRLVEKDFDHILQQCICLEVGDIHILFYKEYKNYIIGNLDFVEKLGERLLFLINNTDDFQNCKELISQNTSTQQNILARICEGYNIFREGLVPVFPIFTVSMINKEVTE